MEENEKQEQAVQSAVESVPESNVPAEENVAETSPTFKSFGLSAELMQGLSEAGFTEPTPIQVKAIPEIMAGHDIIGQALTGTGKTAAFGLPVMNKLQGGTGLRFLVLVPTRELAAQVSAELYRLGRFAGIRTAAFTGGQSYTRQEKMLRQGIDALVATPGRLIDLMESGVFKEVNPEYVVVDEADEMLDMGFIDDVRKIFEGFPGPRQTMLFSATMPKPVVDLAGKILREPVNISTTDAKEIANNDIEQIFHVIEEPERTDAIIRLIDAQQNIEKAIVFCRTREEADALNILLNGRGYNVNCIHGDMEQAQRTRVMGAFRRGEFDILVATDVAARGLDVGDVTHVFNFHLPFDPRGYVHRIGRTGRMGRAGTAITLVTPREMRQLEAIRRQVGAQMENRPIPTRTEVTSLRLKKIFQELHDYELDMDILNQVKTLAVNQDLLVIIAKLLGHQFSGGADQGPEHIGIDGERLDNILSRRKGGRRERDRRGDRGGDRPWKREGRDDRPW
ncbi:MAG: DEAD/DEAH box helicase, partial [Victivallales bacterium]|nr:DEAD/DEAH box helicase [Victivallales bacterium]